MAREDIMGALQAALDRGYPLRSAMQSLYNAGYSKLEIEEAARSLSNPESPENFGDPVEQPKPFSKPSTILTPSTLLKPEEKVFSKFSNYNEPKKTGSSNIFIYTLIVILILLVGGLIATIVFKDQVINFVKNFSA